MFASGRVGCVMGLRYLAPRPKASVCPTCTCIPSRTFCASRSGSFCERRTSRVESPDQHLRFASGIMRPFATTSTCVGWRRCPNLQVAVQTCQPQGECHGPLSSRGSDSVRNEALKKLPRSSSKVCENGSLVDDGFQFWHSTAAAVENRTRTEPTSCWRCVRRTPSARRASALRRAGAPGLSLGAGSWFWTNYHFSFELEEVLARVLVPGYGSTLCDERRKADWDLYEVVQVAPWTDLRKKRFLKSASAEVESNSLSCPSDAELYHCLAERAPDEAGPAFLEVCRHSAPGQDVHEVQGLARSCLGRPGRPLPASRRGPWSLLGGSLGLLRLRTSCKKRHVESELDHKCRGRWCAKRTCAASSTATSVAMSTARPSGR